MTIEISHDQATKLAAFINALRPDWDPPGVLDAIGKARGRADRADLAVAAIRAATTAANRTPAIISLDGPHWRTPHVEHRPLPKLERCPRCRITHQPDTPCAGPGITDGPGYSEYTAAKEAL